jgi:DNA-directed RNA polymerase subunit RPC12/RpoP
MSDEIKCPQCGSKDVFKVHAPSGVDSEPAKFPTPQDYKCIICGRHFNQSFPLEASPKE